VLLAACTSEGGDNVTLTAENQSEDPVVLEIPIAYIMRPMDMDDPDMEVPDERSMVDFNPGAQLFVRDRSAPSADEIEITPAIVAIGAEELGMLPEEVEIDIKGVESSYDGETLVFAARIAPVDADEDELATSTWNLWLLPLATMQPEYLIPSRTKRNEGSETGGGHDMDPHFLTDDRIVFSSTRQVASQARQLNEGRAQIFAALDEDGDEPAAVLHVYDPEQRDAEFEQISFNLSHDKDPVVLTNGEILYSRWNNTGTDHISLYRVDPSGMELSPVYAFHTEDAGTNGADVEFVSPRELEDGRLIAVMKPSTSDTFGGDLVIIDAQAYAEPDQPTWDNVGAGGEGQEPLTDTVINSDGIMSSGGQFSSVYPLRDGTERLLVTWSACRVIDEDAVIDPTAPVDPDAPVDLTADYLPCTLQPENTNYAPPLYGAWIYDPVQDTQRPVVIAEEGFRVSEIIAAEPRDFPPLVTPPMDFNPDLALDSKGQLRIDSVYDLDGVDDSPMGIAFHAEPGTPAYTDRPARFLRVIQPVPIPDDDVFEIERFAFGVTTAFGFREIMGDAPIEPDGSVTINIPANRPLSFQILDVNGRQIGRNHNYWIQVAPGEVLHCTGCHDDRTGQSHGRLDSQPATANPGARALADGSTGFPGTDSTDLFATEPGEVMAKTWDFHRPAANTVAPDRELNFDQYYVDEWTAATLTPDPDITDRAYDPAWNIPPGTPLIVNSLDPALPARVVINYLDHIQPIWERVRAPVDDGTGTLFDTCIGCHDTQGDTVVPAGQLDLTSGPSDIDPDHIRSYRELLSGDQEQWITTGGALADRQRICTTTDVDGNILTTTETLPVGSTMRAGRANASTGFFDCFEGGACGPNGQPALPANCTEDGGTVVPPTANTVDHNGLLSPSELRLLSEWLDIGAQYYNNPFDARLSN
jgi:hypothetical protein